MDCPHRDHAGPADGNKIHYTPTVGRAKAKSLTFRLTNSELSAREQALHLEVGFDIEVIHKQILTFR